MKALRSFSRAFASPFSVDGRIHIASARLNQAEARIDEFPLPPALKSVVDLYLKLEDGIATVIPSLRFPKSCRVATELHYGVVTELRVPFSIFFKTVSFA